MGSDAVKNWGAVGRGDVLLFEPESIVMVRDEASPLYDPRVNLPVEENLVRSIMAHGVKKPIHVHRDGSTVYVVDGRQRLKAALEANKRLRTEGKEAVRIKALIEKGDEASLFGVMVLTNEMAQDDGPLAKAKKAERLIAMGKTEEEVALLFGVSKQTIKNWTALTSCASIVQKAVEKGEVTASVAIELAKLPKSEQGERLAIMTADGPVKGRKAKAAARGQTVIPGAKMRSRVEIEKRVSDLVKSGGSTQAINALLWCLGQDVDKKATQNGVTAAALS